MFHTQMRTMSRYQFSGLFPRRLSFGAPLMRINVLIAFFLVVTSFHVTARAQSATPSPESEEITRLKEQKTRAELEKDIAVAEKAKFDAQFPKPSTSPLSGETKVESATIESDMVSYFSMANAANDLVRALRESGRPIRRLAIYSKPDIDLMLNYNVTTNQIELVRKQYCRMLRQHPNCPEGLETGSNRNKLMMERSPASAPAVKAILGSMLGAFVDMTALLRTNVTVQGHTTDIGESALVSEVFRAIRSKGGLNQTELFYPAAFPPNIDAHTTSEILGKLEELFELKATTAGLTQGLDDNLKKIKKTTTKIEELEARIDEIKVEQKKAQDELNAIIQTQRVYGRRTPFEAYQRRQELTKLTADLSKDLYHANKELDEKKLSLKDLEIKQAGLLARLASGLQTSDTEETIAKLKLLNERFNQFVATLVKVEATTGINSLTAFIRAENLRQVLDGPEAYWLQLAVVKAGGNNRIKSNLVTDIFTGGSRISHSGGVIVQYNLYDLKGKSIVSDTLTQYAGYVKAGKIKQLPNPNTVDVSVTDEEAKEAKQKAGPRDTRVARRQY